MILSTFANIIILLVITGYSSFVSFVLFKNKSFIENYHLIYGFFFLFLLSLLLNFFSPLNKFFYFTTFIGLTFFVYFFFKKKIKINFSFHILILLFLSFITYLQGDNVDSPMYHLQIIKWLSNEKVVFGLSNLEIRFAINSLWFNFLSLLQFKFGKFNNIYFLNFIPFSFLIYECLKFDKEKILLSKLFINIFVIFLIFFSFIHPFNNGVIINHLHNVEIDTIVMIFFTSAVYFTIKFYENPTDELFFIIVLIALISIFVKISYIAIAILPILIYLSSRNLISNKVLIQSLFISSTSSLLWFLKSFINSGCLIFPISITCINTSWSLGNKDVLFYSNIVKSFARDTTDRLKYTDFEHTIETNSWVIPWIEDYLINTALLQISFCLFISSIAGLLILRYLKIKKNNFHNIKKLFSVILLVFILGWFIWFQAPEIRFGWSLIISTPCILFSYLIYKMNNQIGYFLSKISFVTIFVILLITFDNRKNLEVKNLLNPYIKNFNYENIILVKEINNFKIYKSVDWKCYDFKHICVNKLKSDYSFNLKNNYLFIKGKS